jgi:hypothetical protein
MLDKYRTNVLLYSWIFIIIFREVSMASEKQIQANRLNALKGGVKTEEGKAVIRLSALSIASLVKPPPPKYVLP